ncbi:MAG: InlB B-repeat-containing protein, partial [Clostridia bacterium]|nr:InlB B-repeat-containing protein [Clostridia bacterium]
MFKDVPYGSATPTIADPTRQGYQFNGWNIDVADTVSGDVTYTATWVLVHEHSYTVKNTSAKYLKTEATCTEPAVYYYSCSQCIAKGSETFQHGAPLGHDMGAWTETKAPTCTETGSEKRDCSRCDHSETRVVEAKGHSYSSVVTAPTCTADGYTTHTCGDCGHSYTDTPVGKLGHNMGAWTQTKAPTCTDKGTEKRSCTRCSHFETRDVEALKHSFTTYVYNNDATCTEDGTETAKCDRCDETDTRTKSGTAGHKYGQLKAGTDATCTSTGTISHYQCSGCNKYFNENKEQVDSITIPKNSQHTSTEFVYVNNNDGTHSKTHKCCGAVVESEKNIPHDWNDWTYEEDEHIRSCKICSATETTDDHIYTSVTTNPTCTENGKIVKTCLCGHVEEETLPATGHTKDENNVCTGCGMKIVEVTVSVTIADYADANNWKDSTQYKQLVIDGIITVSANGGGNTGKYYENGENWRMYQTESATVSITTNGNVIKSVKITYSNSNNGTLILDGTQVKTGATVPVNGTSITFGVESTKTDVTNGQARITKIEVVYEVAECNGEHDWNEGTVTKEPSCTETGVKLYTCDECGKTKEDTIPVVSHTATKTDAKAPGCETTGTKAYWQCTECEGYFSDEACTKEIENLAAWLQTEGENGGLVPATGHTGVSQGKKDSNCTEPGYAEYWFCDACDNYFSDADCTVKIADLDAWKAQGGEGYIAASHIDEDNNYTCDRCSENICQHTGGTANCKQGAICTKCGNEYGSTDPQNHVNTTEHQQVNATCTAVGYKAGV